MIVTLKYDHISIRVLNLIIKLMPVILNKEKLSVMANPPNIWYL